MFLEKRLSSYVIKLLGFIIPITPENEKNGTDMCELVFFGAQRLGVGIRHISSMNTGLKYIPSILLHRFPLITMGAEAVLSSIH